MARKKRAFLLILLAFLAFLAIFTFRVREDMLDFEVNYQAGKRLRMAETLYRWEDGHYMFKYLPFSAFLYLPLSFLPLDAAKACWYFAVIICLVMLVYLSDKILDSKKRKSVYTIVLPPLLLAKFFLRELQLGQINALVTVILLLMIWLMVSEGAKPFQGEISTGLLCGLATALKPYALIFFIYFLLKKKWKALSFALGFLLVALFAPSLFYGLRGNMTVLREWLATLSRSTPALLTSQDNISILAFFVKWSGSQHLALLFSGVAIALLALLVLAVVFKGKEKEGGLVLECSILLILIPLISPLGWDYTLLMSVLGVMILILNFFEYPKFWRAALIANFFIVSFSLYDLMGRKLYSAFMSWSVLTVNFLILIGYLAYLRFKKVG